MSLSNTKYFLSFVLLEFYPLTAIGKIYQMLLSGTLYSELSRLNCIEQYERLVSPLGVRLRISGLGLHLFLCMYLLYNNLKYFYARIC